MTQNDHDLAIRVENQLLITSDCCIQQKSDTPISLHQFPSDKSTTKYVAVSVSVTMCIHTLLYDVYWMYQISDTMR